MIAVLYFLSAAAVQVTPAGIVPPSLDMRAPSQNCGNFYPPKSVRLNEEGDVELQFTVASDGSVKNIALAKSSGHDLLDQAASQCVARWRYNPATQNGVAVEMPWRVVVKFHIDNGPPMALRKLEWGEYRCIDDAMPSDDDMRKTPSRTTLDFTLHDGAIADAKIFQSSGNDKLDQQALQCFRSLQLNSTDAAVLPGTVEYRISVTWDSGFIKMMAHAALRYSL